MPLANRHRNTGQIWHVTDRCPRKQFLSSWQPQWSEPFAVGWRWFLSESGGRWGHEPRIAESKRKTGSSYCASPRMLAGAISRANWLA